MARSLKKGPFADVSLLKKVDAMNAAGQKQVIKTLFCGIDICSTRRKKACSCICNRGYGWT